MFLGHGTAPLFALYSPWATLVALGGGGVPLAAVIAFLQLPAYGFVLQYAAWHDRMSMATLLLAAAHAAGAYQAIIGVRAFLG